MKRVRTKGSFLRSFFILMALIVWSPASSWAALALTTSYIDFNMDGTHPYDARISYAGGDKPLIGANISVDTVTGYTSDGTMTLDPVAITDGRLNFTTGNFTGYSNNVWTFSGGTISINGAISDIGISADSTLLSGN